MGAFARSALHRSFPLKNVNAKVAYSAILDKFLRLLANIAQSPTRKRLVGTPIASLDKARDKRRTTVTGNRDVDGNAGEA